MIISNLQFYPLHPSTCPQLLLYNAFGLDMGPYGKNPWIQYWVNASDVQVRSGVNGYVENLFLHEDSPHYVISIRVSEPWVVSYTCVLNVTVTVGDWVYAGDVLGTVGIGNQIYLKVDNNFEGLAYCPFDYATESFINQHLAITSDWCLEETVGYFSNPNIFTVD